MGSGIGPFQSIVTILAAFGVQMSAGTEGTGSLALSVVAGSVGTCCATCSEG